MVLFPGTAKEKRVGTYRAQVAAGDRAIYETAGGAGYGPAIERDPALVLEDVLEGYVSMDAARHIYLVAIVDGRVDAEATRQLRSKVGASK
jgi:N-methylhydantoinase B